MRRLLALSRGMTTNHSAYAAAAADPSVLQRIYNRLIIDPDDPAGCWWWDGVHVASKGMRKRGHRGSAQVWAHGCHRLVHRVLWVANHTGETPAQLDHYVCGNGHVGCCNPAHLRPATNAENMQHRRGAQTNNLSSGVRGVSWHKQSGKWMAYITLGGRMRSLGLYTELADAELAARVGRFLSMPYSELDAATTPDEIAYVYSIVTPTVRGHLDSFKEGTK